MKKKLSFNDKITIKGLSYTYPDKKNASLVNINFNIKKNKITGIVGPTGSGKTTLITLIAGLIKPNEGSLAMDKIKLTNSNINAWKNMIAYVPQETIIIDGSISDNITLGLETNIDKFKIFEALKITKLDKFLPYIDSQKMMGERGIKISGGERQRIGLARAIYDDKEIIILDEPFSSLIKKQQKKFLLILKN